MTTARAAPLDTPRIPGSASGLRVTACMAVPETARAAPISAARTVRGSRLYSTARVICSARSRGSPRNASKTSAGGMRRVPKATDAAHSATSSAIPAASHAMRAAAARRRGAESVVLATGHFRESASTS